MKCIQQTRTCTSSSVSWVDNLFLLAPGFCVLRRTAESSPAHSHKTHLSGIRRIDTLASPSSAFLPFDARRKTAYATRQTFVFSDSLAPHTHFLTSSSSSSFQFSFYFYFLVSVFWVFSSNISPTRLSKRTTHTFTHTHTTSFPPTRYCSGGPRKKGWISVHAHMHAREREREREMLSVCACVRVVFLCPFALFCCVNAAV